MALRALGGLLLGLVLCSCGTTYDPPPGPGGGGDGDGDGNGENLAPSFSLAATATFLEDAPDVTVAIENVSAGSAAEDESQTVAFTATSSNATLITSATVVGDGAARTLTLALAADASGEATVTVNATDSVGASMSHSVVVTVTPVNDPPTIAQPAQQLVSGGAPITVQLTGIGPGGGADEAGQTVTLQATTEDATLITSLNVSAVSNGTATLTFEPHPTDRGLTTITVTASDGQAANSTTAVTFEVLVNEPLPTLANVSAFGPGVSGCVSISLDVVDSVSAPVSVRIEVDSGTGYQEGHWQASPAQPLTTSPTGVTHTLVWRSSRDVASAASNVRVRLTPMRGGFAGTPVERTGLSVSNNFAFAAPVLYPAGAGPFQAVLGDVTGDGVLDIVTPESFTNDVAVVAGLGGGTFSAPVSYATYPAGNCTTGAVGSPPKPFSVNLSDQNGDGRLDIIVVHENCNTIGVLLSNGPGTFAPFVTYPVGGNPLFASVADVNEDGRSDLLVVNFSTNNVSLLLGNANGTFAAQTLIPVGSEPNKIAVADFNNDGHVDFVTADSSSNEISIVHGNGNGTFQARQGFPAGVGPRNLAVGDFNGDGRIDVVTANPGPGNDQTQAAVLLQQSNGSFAAPVFYVVGVHPRSATVADIDGDGRLDIGIGNVTSGTASVLLGRGDGTFQNAITLTTGGGTHSVAFQDLNGDGSPELIAANSDDQNVSVSVNQTPVCAP